MLLLLLGKYYYEKETFKIHLKYDYLRTSDTVKILKSLEELYIEVLKSIRRYDNVKYNNENLSFILTIDEIHTGNSIDFKFSKKWITKIKKSDTTSEHQVEVGFSIGLKEVIAFLLIIGVINSPNHKINCLSDEDRRKFEIIQDSLTNNQIWKQLQDAPQETYIQIEKKAKDLTNFFLQNQTFTNVGIEDICIKATNNDNSQQ
jgi:hypothetical protein